jgi:hypothetical protein
LRGPASFCPRNAGTKGKGSLNFFLIAAVVLTLNSNRSADSYSARDVFDKCRTRVAEIDSALDANDIGFTQKMTIESRGGDEDSLVFRITVRHGKFERKLVSGTVKNGDRFNGGYDAFDRMFVLSEYFADKGKVLSSCEFDSPAGNGYYRINYSFSEPSDREDPVNTASALVNPDGFYPVKISERVKGLPLGMEFDDNVDVAYDGATGLFFPGKVVMRIYGKFFFIHGEIGKVTMENMGLEKL